MFYSKRFWDCKSTSGGARVVSRVSLLQGRNTLIHQQSWKRYHMALIDSKCLLSSIISVTSLASGLVRRMLQEGQIEVSQKTGPLDLLTNVDLASQKFIIGSLLQAWPDLTIIGEETIEPDLNNTSQYINHQLLDDILPRSHNYLLPLSDLTLFVDPIDGTKEFTDGLYSNVTILIGVVFKGAPIAGVACHPWATDSKDATEGVLAWGYVGYGMGYYSENRLVAVSSSPIKESKTVAESVVTVTKSRPTKELEKALLAMKPKQVLRVGGSGTKMLDVVQGKADIFILPTPGTFKWDTCATEAILRSIGGCITDRDGKPLTYPRDTKLLANDNGVVATRPEVKHADVIDLLRKSRL